MKTVAVYSEVDADALHVRLVRRSTLLRTVLSSDCPSLAQADEAYCIGPAPSAESYVSSLCEDHTHKSLNVS